VKPTVVIVDDHDGFRSSVRALLEAEGFEVLGEAEDGVSALAAVDQPFGPQFGIVIDNKVQGNG
jgi:DNA-binding NarL/FixJ family response regulator